MPSYLARIRERATNSQFSQRERVFQKRFKDRLGPAISDVKQQMSASVEQTPLVEGDLKNVQVGTKVSFMLLRKRAGEAPHERSTCAGTSAPKARVFIST